jgi:hypothetical protein
MHWLNRIADLKSASIQRPFPGVILGFVPADVAAVVHPSEKNTLRVVVLRQLARHSNGAGDVNTCWNPVVQTLMPIGSKKVQMPSWNPGAKLARLTFRLQGQGRGAVLYSSFHELDWRG